MLGEPAAPAEPRALSPPLAVERAESWERRAQMLMLAEHTARAEPQGLSPPLAVESAERVKPLARLSLPVVEPAEPVQLRAP
jgi:hypothetical protein